MSRTILTFENVRQVIKADQLFKQHGIVARIIPVPEHISSECGMCIEATTDQAEKMVAVMDAHWTGGKWEKAVSR